MAFQLKKGTVEAAMICNGFSLLTEWKIICKLLLIFCEGFNYVPTFATGPWASLRAAHGLLTQGDAQGWHWDRVSRAVQHLHYSHMGPSSRGGECLSQRGDARMLQLGSPGFGLFVWLFVPFKLSEVPSHGEGSP